MTFTAAINNAGGAVAAKANITTDSDKEPVNSGSYVPSLMYSAVSDYYERYTH